ncbi:MAG: hypothetical protein ACOC1I_05925 [Spirochaetota bacterium]
MVRDLKAGSRMVGTMIQLARNPAIALIAKEAGLDFFMVDMEHSTHDMETIADIMRTARLAGIDGFVRVPELSKAFVARERGDAPHRPDRIRSRSPQHRRDRRGRGDRRVPDRPERPRELARRPR